MRLVAPVLPTLANSVCGHRAHRGGQGSDRSRCDVRFVHRNAADAALPEVAGALPEALRTRAASYRPDHIVTFRQGGEGSPP